MRLRGVLLGLLAAAIAAGAAASPATAAARQVPQGFLGMNVGDDALLPGFPLEGQSQDMVAAGVESFHAMLEWRRIEPVRGAYDWRTADRLVRISATSGMRFVPLVLFPPSWAHRVPDKLDTPPAPAAFGAFMAALAARYGSAGTFWAQNPSLPKRPVVDWQIWNEPMVEYFWPGSKRWLRDYPPVLKAGAQALRRTDPRARVILTSIVGPSWKTMRQVYRAKMRRWFDAVSLHPYTRRPQDVVEIVRRVRVVMNRYGDRRKKILVTEFGSPASKPFVKGSPFGYETTQRGQAQFLFASVTALAKARKRLGIEGLFWYTWWTADRDRSFPFDYAGLRTTKDGRIVDKPAFASWTRLALRLEGCARKGATAQVCAVPR